MELAESISLLSPTREMDVAAKLAPHFSAEEVTELAVVGGVLVGMAKVLFAFSWAEHEAHGPFVPPPKVPA